MTTPTAEARATARGLCNASHLGLLCARCMQLEIALDAFAAEAVAREREVCARIADHLTPLPDLCLMNMCGHGGDTGSVVFCIAAAIRARADGRA